MNERTTVVTPDEDTELSGRVDEASAPVGEPASGPVPAVPDSGLEQDRETAGPSTSADEEPERSAVAKRSAPQDEKGSASTSVAAKEPATVEKPKAEEKASVDEEPESTAGKDDSDRTADTGAKSRWRTLIPRPVTAVLAVLLVAAVVCAAVFGWKLKARNDDEAAGQAAMAAAKDYAVALTSIDSAHIDADFATVLNGATGEFKDMYSQSATQLKPLLLQAKSVSKGHVVAASVQSVSGDHAVVMLFVDAQITNVTNPDPRVDRNRILMTMDRVGGRWLASKVDLP